MPLRAPEVTGTVGVGVRNAAVYLWAARHVNIRFRTPAPEGPGTDPGSG